MTTVTVQLNDDIAAALKGLAAAQERSETEVVCEAVAAYVQTARPLPIGLGKYHSGQTDVSEQARNVLRQAVKEKQWP